MSTLAVILVVAGLLVLAVGIFFLVKPPATTGSPQGLSDVKDIIEQVRLLLLAFDSRLRVGVLLVMLGFTLVLVGVWVDVRETKADIEDSASAPALSVSLRPSM